MAQPVSDSNWFARKIVSQLSSDTGNYLPQVKLHDVAGNERSLTDFKGKIVYINVWATDCSASTSMFPYEAQLMKRLRSLHLDSCIQIIDICSGTSERKWRKAMAKYKHEGINLFVENKKKWGIKQEPTYILLDRSGKVIGRDVTSANEAMTIDYILYAATKGINATRATWIGVTGGKFDGMRNTDENERIEYKAWQKSLAPAWDDFFKWRNEFEKQGNR
jgi:thiol-disulfide isomerase/thioredoxin